MRILVLALALVPPGDYLPLKEGARWTYTVEEVTAEAAAAEREVTAVVGSARAIAADEWTEVSHFLGYETCWLRVTPTTVDLKAAATESAPALTILKVPAEAGETWTGTVGRDELVFTARGTVEVEIGRDRLRALHVAFTAAAPEKHAGHAATHGDLWFVSGRGLVKARVTKDLDCHSAATTTYVLK